MSDTRDEPPARGRLPLAKVKGVVQMTAGVALAAAGVPMCVLPGPGVAAIVGGVALASRGQRNFSGRPASKIERKLDAAAAKAGEAARREAAKAARAAGSAARDTAKSALEKRRRS